uniref:Uncharacterized protein n=1 Tax=Arundo donax TaxID=35708 RepID=A0A0A9A7P5_ARUDO
MTWSPPGSWTTYSGSRTMGSSSSPISPSSSSPAAL